MKARKSVLITDLDNTLFDWVHLWHSCFSAMLEKIADISGISDDRLKSEIKEVHQKHGTSEYAFLIEELPSLQRKYQNEDLTKIFAPALAAYREQRRKELRLYPSVAESLLKIKGTGAKIIGYTESMAFYSNYRVRRLGLDGIFDVIFSPKDHDLPKGMGVDQLRKYPAARYEFQHTDHQHTPAGELKPNKDILLSIVRHIGAAPEDCVYVGDSLIKDVAMAKDAGVSDAWAKYGQSQTTAGYKLLREVTHWTDADVDRERQVSQREVKPSFELPIFFSDIFDVFQFGNRESYYDLADRRPLSTEDRKNIVDIWKTIVDVQKHFNDISLRIRGLFITIILALSAAVGVLAGKDLRITLQGVTVYYAMLIPIVGIVGTLLFYFMDRYWYHRLLVGSVTQGLAIERKYRFEIPEIALTDTIGASSPIRLTRRLTKWLADLVVTDEGYWKNGTVHSTGKIELFYKPIVYLFVLVFGLMLLGGGVLIGDKSFFEIAVEKIHATNLNRPRIYEQNSVAPAPS
jgi:FMN phosphatase YigB (HAD superfamily)